MPQVKEIPRVLLLPEVKILKWDQDRFGREHLWLDKASDLEVCPKCAAATAVIYDHRWVHVHDQPIRDRDIWLHVHKRRFYCKTCRKPFTEPVPGIRKGNAIMARSASAAMNDSAPSRRRAFLTGVRLLLPMLVGVAPFGAIYGVVALQSGIGPLQAMLMSSVLFAGASQFLLAQMVVAGAPGLVTFGTVALINARRALCSASLAPLLAPLPRRWKLLLAYLLTDEAYAAAIGTLMQRPQPAHAHWVLFGSGFALWAGWQLSTAIGIALGQQLPSGLELNFS